LASQLVRLAIWFMDATKAFCISINCVIGTVAGATIAALVATWGVSSPWLLPGGLGLLPALPRGMLLLSSPGLLSLLLLSDPDRLLGSVGSGIGSSCCISDAF
jgi:hypothetical protein